MESKGEEKSVNEITPEMKDKLNECYRLLKKRVYTKLELQRYFATGERQIRIMISTIKKKAPVIAPSKSKGYRIATTAEDVSDVKNQYAETLSRIADLAESLAKLGEFAEENDSSLKFLQCSEDMQKLIQVLRRELCRS